MKRRCKLRMVAYGLLASLGTGLLGCSVHPLPQDVSYKSTVDIVRRIRCEASEGLLAAWQNAPKPEQVEKIVNGTTIGFDFRFVIAETNRVTDAELAFERKNAKDEGFELKLAADLNGAHRNGVGENESTRKNTRVFRVIDDLKDLKEAKCGQRVKSTRANLVYPVTGSTGMAEIVRTYIELEKLTDLRGEKTTKKVKKGKETTEEEQEIVTFSDKLEFITTLEVGVMPRLELETTIGVLKLTKASTTAAALRRDLHAVTVVLARDHNNVDVDLPGTGRAIAAPSAITTKSGFQIADVRDKGLQTFMAQRRSVARNRVLIELERRRLVAEDEAVVARVLTGTP
jgi:hypothetical protein